MPVDKKKAALEGGKNVRKKAPAKKPVKSASTKRPVNKKATKKPASKKKAPAVKAKAKPKPKAKRKSKPTGKPPPKPFKPGNKLWMRRDRSGPKFKYDDPEAIWLGAVKYFEWAIKNPIKEKKIFCSFGEITKGVLEKERTFTYAGLCAVLGICTNTWDAYKESDLLKDVCQEVADIMYEQKFSGASAGVFNSSIIARDLNLVDRREDVAIPKNKPGTLADFYATLDKPEEPN